MDKKNAWAAIDQEDVSFVQERLVKIGYVAGEAQKIVDEYKRFLKMRVEHPAELPMYSHEVDDAWHAHILHTEAYRDFCQRVFGMYLDHRPYSKKEFDERKQEYLDVTLSLYKQLFKQDPPEIWYHI